ncbi:hypothetical protein TNCV_2930931 [Trichonephila clavipes]|nr:hypothetical protein TNCV_2930931 [Trichonephila clavipes]
MNRPASSMVKGHCSVRKKTPFSMKNKSSMFGLWTGANDPAPNSKRIMQIPLHLRRLFGGTNGSLQKQSDGNSKTPRAMLHEEAAPKQIA